MAPLAVLGLMASACASPDDETATDSTFAPNTDLATTSTVRSTSVDSVEVSVDEDSDPTGSAAESTSTAATEAAPARTSAEWVGLDFILDPVTTLEEPIVLLSRPGSPDLWIAERAGRIRRVSPDGQVADEVVLDLTDRVTTEGEGGLLGLAFSADGQLLYVSYTDRAGDSVVAEYAMDAASARPGTERRLLEVDQPFRNHNGGQISFGPDGMLYVGLGDGGGAGDPEANGQNPETLLGAILRIDPANPSNGQGYGIPADNPFASGGGRPEIFLYGLRNPWRFSFDARTGDLWIGDVGQNRVEEITLVPAGSAPTSGRAGNLGWPVLEGNDPFEGSTPPADHIAPIFTYSHDNNRCSITGGYVYRGPRLDALQGTYLFADYCTGEIFGLEELASGEIVVGNVLVDRRVGPLVSFGEGPDGEVYVLEAAGRVSRIDR